MWRSPVLYVGIGMLLVAVAVTWVATRDRSSPGTPTPPLSAPACLRRENQEVLSGEQPDQYKDGSPSSDRTVDARRATFVSFPFNTLYPVSLGSGTPARRVCLIGGLVEGQQSRKLTWDQMKSRHDGAGARVAGEDWYVVDGLRVSNVEDGIDPRGTDDRYPKDGDGFILRNLYFSYIRDDCVENDDIAGGVIVDSLFDGCNTGISERPTKGSPQFAYPAPKAETLRLKDVLLRLQAMPGPRGHPASVRGHGQLFKWSDIANRLVIEDSIFLVETVPNDGTSDFPPGTTARNVTVVWLGPGTFPGRLPAGVEVTRDREVWDRARARWLDRHGCSDVSTCTRITAPVP
jgi:hypothetical protein